MPGNVNSSKRLLSNVRVLTTCALLIALSVAIAYFCKMYLTFGMIRVTIENLPVFIAGMFFGPLPGLFVAVSSDLLSCLLAANAVNPIITLGAAAIGVLGGLIPSLIGRKKKTPTVILTVLISHVIGSMLIKSLGMRLYYSTPMIILFYRIPLYIGISAAESVILILLLKSKAFCRQIGRITK